MRRNNVRIEKTLSQYYNYKWDKSDLLILEKEVLKVDRGQIAKDYFEKGYNCAQAVLMAFNDLTGLDEKTAAMISQPFGGGMGGMREVCGTLSGVMMVVGMLYGNADCGNGNPENSKRKRILYERVQALAKDFERDNGSIICRELLGLSKKRSEPKSGEHAPEHYKKRPCKELAYYAANLLDEYIGKVNNEDASDE